MVGLTYGDTQALFTPAQYGGMALNMLLLFLGKHQKKTALLCVALAFCVFWNDSAMLDTDWLFRQAEKFHDFSWGAYLDRMPKESYIQFQTPFYPFFVSRMPMLWAQQLMVLPIIAANSLLICELFGNSGRFILATPLYFVLSTQPSTDVAMFTLVLLALRAYQLGYLCTASVLYGLAWLAKPLVLVTLPMMAYYLRGYILLSFLIWAAYVKVSLQYEFGQKQWRFMQHQLFLKRIKPTTRENWQVNSLKWRYRTVAKPTLSAWFAWLFPAYTRRVSLLSAVCLFCILFGFGNMKYFYPLLLFFFPVVSL